MKNFRNIFVVIGFLLISTGAFSQQQAAIRVTDATPTAGQYTIDAYLYYNGSYYSTIASSYNVTLTVTTYIPFSIPYDIEPNLYRVVVLVNEPGSGPVGPYVSALFNTDYWRYNDITVGADLP